MVTLLTWFIVMIEILEIKWFEAKSRLITRRIIIVSPDRTLVLLSRSLRPR